MGTFLGDPCKNGHIGRRYNCNHACVECTKFYGMQYKQAHNEKERLRKNVWKHNNRDIVLKQKNKRRGALETAEGFCTVQQLLFILKSQNGRCAYCGTEDQLSVDHMQSLFRGGSNFPSNIQWLCVPCNSSKNHRSDTQYRKWKKVGRRTPRADYIRMLFKIMGL